MPDEVLCKYNLHNCKEGGGEPKESQDNHDLHFLWCVNKNAIFPTFRLCWNIYFEEKIVFVLSFSIMFCSCLVTRYFYFMKKCKLSHWWCFDVVVVFGIDVYNVFAVGVAFIIGVDIKRWLTICCCGLSHRAQSIIFLIACHTVRCCICIKIGHVLLHTYVRTYVTFEPKIRLKA